MVQEWSMEEGQKRSMRIPIWVKGKWMLWMLNECMDLRRGGKAHSRKTQMVTEDKKTLLPHEAPELPPGLGGILFLSHVAILGFTLINIGKTHNSFQPSHPLI